MSANFAGRRMPEQLSARSIELPESVRLILGFNRYCETKQACPSLYLDERGTPSCRATGNKCAFENCPKVRSA
jgi:hypothetical protein